MTTKKLTYTTKECIICQKEFQSCYGMTKICSPLCRKKLDKINSKKYQDKPETKAYKRRWGEENKERIRAKKKITSIEYRRKNRQKHIDCMREYHKRPYVIVKEKEYRASPENKKKRKLAYIEYRAKNRDKLNEHNRLWRQKPEVKEANRKYMRVYEQKPECKEQKRNYRIKNKEKICEHNRLWRQKPENKRRAKDFGQKYRLGEIITPRILEIEKSLSLIREMYIEKNYDTNNIAKKFHTSSSVILAVLRRNNIPIKPKIFCNKRAIPCSNGLLVKSNSERIIVEILLQKNIPFIYEPNLPTIRFIPDFYIPEKDLYVEYAGLTDKDWYNEQLEKKKETYEKLNINAVFINKPEQITDVLAYQKV
jgi:hypothetical protein